MNGREVSFYTKADNAKLKWVRENFTEGTFVSEKTLSLHELSLETFNDFLELSLATRHAYTTSEHGRIYQIVKKHSLYAEPNDSVSGLK